MSELITLQEINAIKQARLILKAHEFGFNPRQGEAWRDPRWAKQLHEMNLGSLNSLHIDRLAADYDFTVDGRVITLGSAEEATRILEPLGKWWELQGGAWGGRWGDPRHWSLPYQGRK